MKVEICGVSWAVDAQRIVDSIYLDVPSKEIVGLVGPNGSGKSSLLRLIYRVSPPNSGMILLDEQDIWRMSAKEVAQSEAVVAQESMSYFDFTVEEIVFMGRTPHKKLFQGETTEDYKIVYDALEQVSMQSFSQRNFRTLSGGEKQRVLIARALAQQAQVLVLDEPTNHLDIRSQLEILELMRSLDVTTIVALHDLNLAAEFCDRLYLLQSGRVVTWGRPTDVLTPSFINDVYGVYAEIETRGADGRIHILFSLAQRPSNTKKMDNLYS